MSKRRIPYEDLVAQYLSLDPKTVEGLNNSSVLWYYTNWCSRKVYGVYEITGMPDTWDIDYVYQRLFLDGHFCITDTAMGVLPLRCGFSGVNVFEHPTRCVIANPVLGSFERTIGEDCALIKLQSNYVGIWDIINRYAVLLSMCDSSIAVNLMNSKVAAIFGAETKQEAETYKQMFDQINQGRPGVFVANNLVQRLSDRLVFNRVKEAYIADKVEDLKQQLINDFLSDIGINNANTEKRERLVSNEVMSNRQEVRSGAESWIRNVKEGFREANRLYGLNLDIRLADWNEIGGEENDISESGGLSSGDAGQSSDSSGD